MNDSASWPTRTVSELAGEVTSGGTPQSGSSRYYTEQDGIPFAKIDDLTATAGAFISDTFLHVNDVALRETALKAYPPGTILVSMYGTIGLVKITSNTLSANQAVAALVPPFKCDLKYLYHFLVWSRSRWEKFKSQTTQANINGSIVKNFPISIPSSVIEQQRIAEILDTLDDQIGKTEQRIAKLVSTQRGLTVDLLTKGIDEKGALRDFERDHAWIRNSLIGPVPVDWEVAPLSTYRHPERPYLKTGPFGSSLKQEHWVDEGVPVVTIGSLGDGYFIDNELLYIAESTASALSSYALSPGDIVFSRVADVGRSVVVGEREKNWIMSSNMMWISVDPKRVDPRFVRANIAANPNLRSQIRRYVNSAGRDVANAKIMNLLQFPWPPLKEQISIADRIAMSDELIATERLRAAKLYAYKTGLMTDLLTGRIRIPAEAAS